jgi:L-asparaginase
VLVQDDQVDGGTGHDFERSKFAGSRFAGLPAVALNAPAGCALIDAAVAAGAKGLVIAGVGNGNLTQAAVNALAAQARKGIVCVRASRVTVGLLTSCNARRRRVRMSSATIDTVRGRGPRC